MPRLLLACLLLAPWSAAAAEGPALAAKVEFRCLWWSPEQQRNFNPNQPPPRTTEVTIDRWEYTDPVGVPHPDVVTVHASVRNNGNAATGAIRVKAEIRWKAGPQGNPKAAQWEPRTTFLASLDASPVPAGEQLALQAPVALQAKIAALESRDWWPYEMEIVVTGTDLRTGRRLFREVRPFPILRGD